VTFGSGGPAASRDRLDRRSSRAAIRDGGVDHAESKTPDTVITSERARKKLSRHGWAPADRPRRPVLFVNPTSGGGKAMRAGVAERARERGIEVIVLNRVRTWPRWSAKS
jgi:hypothetical protein